MSECGGMWNVDCGLPLWDRWIPTLGPLNFWGNRMPCILYTRTKSYTGFKENCEDHLQSFIFSHVRRTQGSWASLIGEADTLSYSNPQSRYYVVNIIYEQYGNFRN